MKTRTTGFLLLLVLAMTAFYTLRARPAGIPAFFDQSLTYKSALEKSRATGKPVFALFSADWCAPCHQFESGALADPRIAAWLTANTIPVFLDITSGSSPGAPAAAEFGITGIPAILLIKDGRPVGRHEGTIPADALLNWLDAFSKESPTPAG